MKRPRKRHVRTLPELRAQLRVMLRRIELDPRVIAAQARARRHVLRVLAAVRAEHDHELRALQGMISRRERGRPCSR